MKRIALPGPLLLTLLSVMPSLAQTDLELRKGSLEVTISRYEGEQKVDDQEFRFRLAFGEQGSLRVADAPDRSVAKCTYGVGAPAHGPTGQFVGRQVDAMVSSVGDGKFKIHLVVTERSLAGCRPVGDLEIPVYANRIVSHDLVLADGGVEEVRMGADKSSIENRAMRVALTIVPK